MTAKGGVIYVLGGAAAEYSHLALNHFVGCLNECDYCYVPHVLHISPELFHASVTVKKDLFERLAEDVKKYKGTDQRVMLCFTCDPYPKIDAEVRDRTTRRVLQLLVENDIPFQVLTKNGAMAEADFDLYRPGIDAFAVTLTTVNDGIASQREPGADLPFMRIQALKAAKARGIETWVSCEPIIEPAEILEVIDQTHGFVELYKFGLRSRYRYPRYIDWGTLRTKAGERYPFGLYLIEKCKKLGVKCFLKSSLTKFMGADGWRGSDNRTVTR